MRLLLDTHALVWFLIEPRKLPPSLREILAKPGRHTEAEQALMRGHVGHAQRVLEGAGLDLPVAEALAQMHERLDGTGYPNGLAGGAIGRVGRVLAVADVYCARDSKSRQRR